MYILCSTYPKVNPLDRGIPMHLMVICSIKYTSMYIEKELIKRKYRCAVYYIRLLVNVVYFKIRQSKINSRWVAGPFGQTNRRPSV